MNQELRPLSLLYQLVLKKLKQHNSSGNYSCICVAIRWADLLSPEKDAVNNDFNSNRPKRNQHKEFYYNPYFVDGGYWWTQNNGGTEQRIKFLNMLIQKHKDDETRRKVTKSV